MSVLQQNPDNSAAMPHIPGYRITRIIGHGGMSTVYLGAQLSLSRDVAIKVMRADVLADEVSRRRFENEARTIARLEHPHIVSIYEVGRTSEGQPWYSMPYLGCGHLGQRDLTHDHTRIRQILEALLSALAFAHARGVIHRDVKAENVLFDESERPLLADFGIALRRGHGTRVTLTGLAIGSTAYMAPEQARGLQVDPRSDLYSVGVLAWEMLTGQLPYQADDAVAMAIAHVQTPLPRLPPGLRHWQRFMNLALAKQPQKRFHNAEHMLAVLRAVPLSSTARLPHLRWLTESAIDIMRAHKALTGTGLTIASALSIALFLSLRQSPEPITTPAATPVKVFVPAIAETAIQEQVPAILPPATETKRPITAPSSPSRPLRTAPTSPASQRLEQMQSFLVDKSPPLPRIRQAIDLLLAAHKADPEHLQLPTARNTLLRTLRTQIVAAIEDGDDVRVQALLKQLPRIRTALPLPPGTLEPLHEAIYKALSIRLDNTRDVAIAQLSLEAARLAALPSEQMADLRARMRALEPPTGWFTLRFGKRLVHIDKNPVNRAAYARFAKATSRPATPCRERTSMLQILAPRDWARPGFVQTGNDPVVCISWQDATDYAVWASQRDGRHYRLLNMNEAAALPFSTEAPRHTRQRPLAEWRNDCDTNDCTRRIASSHSWRSSQDFRLLAAERGYHDVGFRLALDPPALAPSTQADERISDLNH